MPARLFRTTPLAAPLSALLGLMLAAGAAPAAHAQAPTVNRCTLGNGKTIFTDRRCDEIGAQERLPRGGGPSGARAPGYRGCARTLRELVYEITSAIDRRDVNRLGGVYHWTGASDAQALRTFDRLQAIVDRPLVDIVALRGRPAPVAAAPPPAEGLPAAPAANSPPAANSAPAAEAASPEPPTPRVVGLRLEQTLRNSATPSRTVFGLHRNYDCWWVSLPGG